MSNNIIPRIENLVLPLEIIFALHFLMNFFVSFRDEKNKEVTELKPIAIRYYETNFWSDFIPLLPL